MSASGDDDYPRDAGLTRQDEWGCPIGLAIRGRWRGMSGGVATAQSPFSGAARRVSKVSSVFDFILNLPPWLVLTLVFLFPALEASAFVGVLVPGEIGVVLGGVVANQGKLPVSAVVAAAIAGAAIGDTIGYFVGKRWGEQILGHLPDRILDEQKMENAEDALRRHGGKAVFFGRFTAALRALIPGAAGMSGMHYPTFLGWNVLGGAIWGTAFVMIGYLAGSQYKTVERYANWFGIALLVGIIAVVVVRHRREASRPDGR